MQIIRLPTLSLVPALYSIILPALDFIQRQSPVRLSGFTGVYFLKDSEKWRASITVEGKRVELGVYFNKNNAIRARKKANKKYGFKG
jgi:hypothetical protein